MDTITLFVGFFKDFLKIYTIILAFQVFSLIFTQTDLLNGFIAVIIFVILMILSIEQHEMKN